MKNLLDTENIDAKSLRKEYIKALEISSFKKTDEYYSLKSWQEKLLGLMSPSDREIMWVVGKRGAEGKSWLQGYIEEHYGFNHVFRATMSKNSDSILHCLSKRVVSLINVFILNIPRSFSMIDVPYKLMEEIKDGQAISSKYNSKVLHFKTPNILIVFSNRQPYMSGVSKDRWKVFNIKNDELH